MYEQMNNTHNEIIAFWDRAFATTMMPWLVEGQSAWKENWERFIETVGFGYETGLSNCSTMAAQLLELYSASYRGFTDYRHAVEKQWLHCVEGLREVQQTQEEKGREFLGNVRNLMYFAQREPFDITEEDQTHHYPGAH